MSEDELDPVEEIPDKLTKRSNSQLETFARCSEQFRIEKTLYPRPPKSPALWLIHGSAFHAAAEEHELTHRSGDMKEMYLRAFAAETAKAYEEQPDEKLWTLPFRTKSVANGLKNYQERGLTQVENYLDFIENTDWNYYELPDETPGIEWGFEIDLNGVIVVGYVDFIRELVDGTYSVVDLKTGNRVKSTRQLGLYKLAIEEQLGIEIIGGEYYYSKDAELVSVNLDRYTRKYLEETYGALERGIQNEVFIPNPGDACGLCAVKDLCRELGNNPIPLEVKGYYTEGDTK